MVLCVELLSPANEEMKLGCLKGLLFQDSGIEIPSTDTSDSRDIHSYMIHKIHQTLRFPL